MLLDEAGGDVQQPVTKSPLGSASAGPQSSSKRGSRQEADRCEAEFGPGRVDGEVAGGQAAESDVLAAPDVVFDSGVSAVPGARNRAEPSPEQGVPAPATRQGRPMSCRESHDRQPFGRTACFPLLPNRKSQASRRHPAGIRKSLIGPELDRPDSV
ncbi:hypothetical protein [Streptomyces roseifaciens]|uniref:hypothetical protein n=1 Tax=Streptomyces roseifaciens TaxID=1488406 RepID=UPI00118763D0|nr:hypothetical protein [Streptomyces roseifaciens]